MPSTGMWLDYRLKKLFIESKNICNGLWTRKLWSSEVGASHEQRLTCRTDRYLLSFVTFEHNMSSDCIDPYMDRFSTQRAFHRVYEHTKRTSDEKVMVVQSWHCRAHSLLSSARRAQLKEVSSASHSSSLLRLATHSSSLLSSAIHNSSLLSSAIHNSSLLSSATYSFYLSSARRGQLIPRELGQKRSALPHEVSSASHSSSLLRLATYSSSLLSSAIHSSSLLSSATRAQPHSSSSQTLPSKKAITWVVEVRFG